MQVEKLGKRLEGIAGFFFVLTLVVALTVLVGLRYFPDWTNANDAWFTLFEAGLPALGTAVFGIRFQGDFGGSAIRSQATAYALRGIAEELDQGTSLTRAADLAEQAARIMYSDLDEWRPPLPRLGRVQPDAARCERLADQHLDLGVDAPEIGRGAPLHSRPQGRVDAKRIGLSVALVRHFIGTMFRR